MEALKAIGVCQSYGTDKGRTRVLEDFSLTLNPGAFDALMGPSGSGKSTFLHLAAGLILPDAGRIEVAGCDVTRLSDAAAARFRREHVGVVFQDFNLLDVLTVAENIVLPARLSGQKPDGKRLEELLEKVGLSGKSRRSPRELSGGERQRVALARALFARPAVVLADEPTGNLDAVAAKNVCALLRELNKTEKSAILVVTHDPVVAACAGRVHFLKDGRVTDAFDPDHAPENVSRRYLEVYAS